MDELTKQKKTWIRRLSRAFRDKPESLLLYNTDGNTMICKKGVASDDICESITNSNVCCGCVLTDMHDDAGRGR